MFLENKIMKSVNSKNMYNINCESWEEWGNNNTEDLKNKEPVYKPVDPYYEFNFPMLGKEPTPIPTPILVDCSKKSDLKTTDLPNKQRNMYEKDNTVKVDNSEQMFRSRLCKSVNTGTKCGYGEKCRFAHHSMELQLTPCIFGKKCKFVCWENNRCFNVIEEKKCNFIHLDEDKRDYFKRVNIDIVEEHKPVKNNVKTKTTDIKLNAPKINPWGNIKNTKIVSKVN